MKSALPRAAPASHPDASLDGRQQAALRPARLAPARDIVLGDPTLRASYLLRFASDPAAPPLDEAAAGRFLLWFAVEGRHGAQHVRVTPDYVAFLSRHCPPFSTRLAAHVCGLCGGLARFGGDLRRFHAWYYGEGAARFRLGPLLTSRERDRVDGPDQAEPASMRRGVPDLSHLPGVNVIGIADGVLGIGEDARCMTDVLRGAGIPQSIFNVRYPADVVATDRVRSPALVSDRPLFPINVICLPPFETSRLRVSQGDTLFGGRYNVGYWPWELSSLPPSWHFVFDQIDEIWASSRYLAEVFGRLTDKPVTYMPPHVGVPAVMPLPREALGYSAGDMLFLCMFDLNSYVARKNPGGAIAAFREAFPDRDGRERLLIKTLSGEANPAAFAALRRETADDHRIVLLDGALPREEACALLAAADCYVSLHRAEGFGRIMAEAMLLGVPVIATGWSGNASFLGDSTGYPVPYGLRAVGPDEYVYAEGSVWAEPSIGAAAELMRRVRAGGLEVERRRQNARRVVERTYGLEPAAARVRAWLEALADRAGRTDPPG